MSLKESLRPTVSFKYKNADTANSRRLAIFPGHYNTAEISKLGADKYCITYGNPEPLRAAGYECDQVSDDYNSQITATLRTDKVEPIQIKPCNPRTRVSDFLNYVKYSGAKVSKIRITDYSNDTHHSLFNGQMEISQSSIGSKGGTDYLQLCTYIDPRNFQTNIIEIDLEEQNLLLDETTVVILEIPANANFQIDYILS